MTTIEDTLTDEEKEKFDKAELESKREKTKYGDKVESDE
jgi:hypothetical protein